MFDALAAANNFDEIYPERQELRGEEWLDRLRGRVPCAPVNDVRQALADPQVLARDMIVEVEHPDFGPLKLQTSCFFAFFETLAIL